MKWHKYGAIWTPPGDIPWALTHATLPVAQAVGNEWWIYVGSRDALGKTRIGRVVLDARPLPSALPTVVRLDPEPILPLGAAGTFDDSGMMPAWLHQEGDEVRLYYIGWNVIGTVPYRLSIGVALSDDGGRTFRRYSEGPLLDRSVREPYFTTSPCVHREGDLWRMWYVSCTGWHEINGRWEPAYHVKYAESRDGFDWQPTSISCVEAGEGFAIARPCVFRHGAKYSMLYPYRALADYRTKVESSYRFGYAESEDGIQWTRRDEEVGIARSAEGWDSEMIEYAWIQPHRGETYLLYNGNGFGRTGFGTPYIAEPSRFGVLFSGACTLQQRPNQRAVILNAAKRSEESDLQ